MREVCVIRKIFLIMIIFIPIIIFAEPPVDSKIKIAILDFENAGVSKENAKSVTEIITTEIVNSGFFEVVERGKFSQLLKETKIQLSGIVDTGSAVQVGKMLSVDKLIFGTFNKFGSEFFINVKVVDVTAARIEYAEKHLLQSEKALMHDCEIIAKKLIGKMTGRKVEISSLKTSKKKKSEVVRTRPYKWLAVGALGAGVTAFVAGYIFDGKGSSSYSDASTLYEEYKLKSTDENWEKVKNASKDGDDYYLYRNISYGAGALFIVTSGVLFFIEEDTPTDKISFYLDDKKFLLSFKFDF